MHDSDIVANGLPAVIKKIRPMGRDALKRFLLEDLKADPNDVVGVSLVYFLEKIKNKLASLAGVPAEYITLSRLHFNKLKLYSNLIEPQTMGYWYVIGLQAHVEVPLTGGSARELAKRIILQLRSLQFETYILTAVENEILWMSINIDDNGRMFEFLLVHYPKSDVVFVTAMSAKLKKYVLGALAHAFGAKEASYTGLKSNKLNSLKANVLFRDAAGAFRRYQSGAEPTPLDRASQAKDAALARAETRSKRRIENVAENSEDNSKRSRVDASPLDSNVLVDEDKEKRIAQIENADRILGESNDLLTLNSVDLRLNKIFAGPVGNDPKLMVLQDNALPMRVRLTGKNVLAGVHELIKLGIVSAPVPAVFSQLVGLTNNEVTVD